MDFCFLLQWIAVGLKRNRHMFQLFQRKMVQKVQMVQRRRYIWHRQWKRYRRQTNITGCEDSTARTQSADSADSTASTNRTDRTASTDSLKIQTVHIVQRVQTEQTVHLWWWDVYLTDVVVLCSLAQCHQSQSTWAGDQSRIGTDMWLNVKLGEGLSKKVKKRETMTTFGRGRGVLTFYSLLHLF